MSVGETSSMRWMHTSYNSNYAVVLKKGVDKTSFHATMSNTSDVDYIPDRRVGTVYNMPLSNRSFVVSMSRNEALTLRNDSRVWHVCLYSTSSDL